MEMPLFHQGVLGYVPCLWRRGSVAAEQDEGEHTAWDEGTLGARGQVAHGFRYGVQPRGESSDLSPYYHSMHFLPMTPAFLAPRVFTMIVAGELLLSF